jgi:hypothetical protein
VRSTLLKQVHTAPLPDPAKPETMATPRWISPYESGRLVAKMLGAFGDLPFPVKRRKIRKPRQRVGGVALKTKPWSAA